MTLKCCSCNFKITASKSDINVIYTVLLYPLTANWLMIKYFGGEKYHSHCSGVGRMAIVFVTCDPGTQRVCLEYRDQSLFS